MLCVLGDAYEKKTTRLADGSIIYDKHHFTEPIQDTRFWGAILLLHKKK